MKYVTLLHLLNMIMISTSVACILQLLFSSNVNIFHNNYCKQKAIKIPWLMSKFNSLQEHQKENKNNGSEFSCN